MHSPTPLRLRLVNTPRPAAYSDGWRDGCAYAERLGRWNSRIGGFFVGFVSAIGLIAFLLLWSPS